MKSIGFFSKVLLVAALALSSGTAWGFKVVINGDCTKCKITPGEQLTIEITCKGLSGTCVSFDTDANTLDISNCPCGGQVTPGGITLPELAQPDRVPLTGVTEITEVRDVFGEVIGTEVVIIQQIKRKIRELRVHPVPVRNKTLRFNFDSAIDQNVTAAVFDMTRQETFRKQISCVAGMNHENIRLPDGFSGPCLLTLIGDSETLSERIFVE